MAALNPSAANPPGTPTTPTPSTSGASTTGDGINSPDTKDGISIKDEPHDPSLMSPAGKKEDGEGGVKKEEDDDGDGKSRSSADSEIIKELKMQLK